MTKDTEARIYALSGVVLLTTLKSVSPEEGTEDFIKYREKVVKAMHAWGQTGERMFPDLDFKNIFTEVVDGYNKSREDCDCATCEKPCPFKDSQSPESPN